VALLQRCRLSLTIVTPTPSLAATRARPGHYLDALPHHPRSPPSPGCPPPTQRPPEHRPSTPSVIAVACRILTASAATVVEYCSKPPPNTSQNPSYFTLCRRFFSLCINCFSPCRAEKGKTYPVKVCGVEMVPDPVARG
jgi:hypothetical protein